MTDREEKKAILENIRAEKERVRQKILYHRRKIDKLHSYSFDTPERGKSRLAHWRKIELLNIEYEDLDRQRKSVMGLV